MNKADDFISLCDVHFDTAREKVEAGSVLGKVFDHLDSPLVVEHAVGEYIGRRLGRQIKKVVAIYRWLRGRGYGEGFAHVRDYADTMTYAVPGEVVWRVVGPHYTLTFTVVMTEGGVPIEIHIREGDGVIDYKDSRDKGYVASLTKDFFGFSDLLRVDAAIYNMRLINAAFLEIDCLFDLTKPQSVV